MVVNDSTRGDILGSKGSAMSLLIGFCFGRDIRDILVKGQNLSTHVKMRPFAEFLSTVIPCHELPFPSQLSKD